jgi:23S rRNA pseudouridine2605 synthase
VTPQKIGELARGITVDGVAYQPIRAVFDREMGANSWLTVTLTEGKKREVRRALESLGLTVNRLIRVSYGPFHLTDLKPGQVEEIPPDILAQALEALGAPMAPAPPADTRPAPKSHLGRGPRADRLKTRRKIPRRT